MTPTLVTTRSLLELFADLDGLLTRPEAAYFRHPMQSGVWSFVMENLYRPIPTEARKKIREGLERFQSALGYLPPIEFEAAWRQSHMVQITP